MHFYMDVVHSLTRHVVRRCVHRRVLLHQCLLVCEQRHTLGFQLQIIHCRLFPLPSPTSHRCSGERTPAARFRNRSVSRREGQSTHRRGLSGEVAPSGIAAGVGAGWSPENPPALRMRPDVGAAVAQQVEIEIDDCAEPHALARARRALESADERMPLRNLFSPVHVVRAGPGLPLVAGRSRRVPQQYGGRVWTQALVRNGVQGCADGSAGGQTISCPGPDRDTAHACVRALPRRPRSVVSVGLGTPPIVATDEVLGCAEENSDFRRPVSLSPSNRQPERSDERCQQTDRERVALAEAAVGRLDAVSDGEQPSIPVLQAGMVQANAP